MSDFYQEEDCKWHNGDGTCNWAEENLPQSIIFSAGLWSMECNNYIGCRKFAVG